MALAPSCLFVISDLCDGETITPFSILQGIDSTLGPFECKFVDAETTYGLRCDLDGTIHGTLSDMLSLDPDDGNISLTTEPKVWVEIKDGYNNITYGWITFKDFTPNSKFPRTEEEEENRRKANASDPEKSKLEFWMPPKPTFGLLIS